MKRFVWLAILAVGVYLAYTQYVRMTSGEVAQVHRLEKEFRRATDRFISSVRGVGEPGLVILADPETAERMVKDIHVRLQELMPKLTDEKAIDRALKLDSQIVTFFERYEID